MNKVKSAIQQNTSINDNHIDLINSALNKFGGIRSTENSHEIKNLDFEILKLFPLTDRPTLIDQFKLIYPNI